MLLLSCIDFIETLCGGEIAVPGGTDATNSITNFKRLVRKEIAFK
jgi:nicotinamidase-related amidase